MEFDAGGNDTIIYAIVQCIMDNATSSNSLFVASRLGKLGLKHPATVASRKPLGKIVT